MEQLAERVVRGQARSDDVEGLERLAHGLAGSSGTLGFAAVGEAARALELALKDPRPADIHAAIADLKEKLPR